MVTASPSSSLASAAHTTVVDVVMSVLGVVVTVDIDGDVLSIMMVTIEMPYPPHASVAVAVHVSVSPGDTIDGDKARLASVPSVSPASFVHA